MLVRGGKNLWVGRSKMKMRRTSRADNPLKQWVGAAAAVASSSDVAAARRSDILNGLTREEPAFILEKLVGLNDKNAAIAAGFTLSMVENTKQKIWARPAVRWEFGCLAQALDIATEKRIIAKLEAEQQRSPIMGR